MKSKSIRIVFAIAIFGFGAIVPFVDALVVVQVFYLLIPFAMLFLGSLIYLIASLFSKAMRSKNTFYVTWLFLIFIVSQSISTYAVNKIQRHRAKLLIEEIESAALAGVLPTHYNTSLGIEFQKLDKQGNFKISYSRGFMVREVYDSTVKSWKSFGWND